MSHNSPDTLLPSETIIIGRYFLENDFKRGDDNFRRIDKLTRSKLVYINSILGSSLYRDPSDGRAWELTDYLAILGGGVPLLHAIPEELAKKIFALRPDSPDLESIALRILKKNTEIPSHPINQNNAFVDGYETTLSGVGYEFERQYVLRMLERIRLLTTEYLKLVATLGDCFLYKEPQRDVYWELVNFDYPPQSLGVGGKTLLPNPHILHCVDKESAFRKFGLNKRS